MEPPLPRARYAGWALLITLFIAAPQRAWAGPGETPRAQTPRAQTTPAPTTRAATNIVSASPAPSAKRPCRCRYDGRKYKLGAIICMTDFNGGRRALKCGMELNNTSWIAVPHGCQPVS